MSKKLEALKTELTQIIEEVYLGDLNEEAPQLSVFIQQVSIETFKQLFQQIKSLKCELEITYNSINDGYDFIEKFGGSLSVYDEMTQELMKCFNSRIQELFRENGFKGQFYS